MNNFKILRAKMGLSQYELAACLGISRSTINMIERGCRELPKQADYKHSNIILYLEEIGTFSNVKRHEGLPDSHGLDKLLTFHRDKLEECEYNIIAINRRLAAMKKTYDKFLAKLDLISGIEKEIFPLYRKEPVDDGWIAINKPEIEKKIIAFSRVEQQILQDRIDMQMAQAEMHKNYIEKYTAHISP